MASEEPLPARDQSLPAFRSAAGPVDQPPQPSPAEHVTDVVTHDCRARGDPDHDRERKPAVAGEGAGDDQSRLSRHERTGRLGGDEREEQRVPDPRRHIDQRSDHRHTESIDPVAVAKLTSVDAERARELLTAERARIERALAGRARQDDGEPADEFDPANLASDLYQDELDEGLEDDLREQLAAVERAEQRLIDGTYGLSIESGEPIPDERLEILPTAERTADEERARG
jgi:DnaK suppressor protein